MGTVARKIRRDLTARGWRTILVALSVFIGVLAIVSITTAGQAISRQLERDLKPGEMAMLRVFVEIVPGARVDNAAVLDRLRALPDVVRVEGQAVYNTQWRRVGEDDFHQGDLFAYSEPFGTIQLEPPRLVRGRYPQPGRHEIAIERRMAEQYHLDVGQALEQQMPDGSPIPMTIVGIVFQPYMYLGSGTGSTSLYATYQDAQQILGFSGFSSFYARHTQFNATLQRSAEFRRTLERETPYRSVYYVRTDPAQNPFLVSVRQFVRLLSALSILLLVVACLLVTNMIHAITAQQHAQIGAMKALGATRAVIVQIYLGLAFGYGLLGTLPGVLLGVLAGREAAHWLAPLANTYLEQIPFSWSAVAQGVALGLLIPLMTALPPVLHASTVTILEAMSDTGLKSDYGQGLLPTLVRLARLPLPLVQVVNRIVHRKVRLALTFAALMAAGAAFMAMLAVVDTLDDVLTYMEQQIGHKMTRTLSSADIAGLGQALFMNENVREIKPGTAIDLVVLPDEDHAAPPGDPPTVLTGAAPGSTLLPVLGIDPATDLSHLVLLQDATGVNQLDAHSLLIAASVAEKYGVGLGDTLTLQTPNRTDTFTITGIADFPLQIGFMDWQQLRSLVGELRGAPTPNAYWERVRLEPNNGDHTVWAVGIDEQAATFLAPTFDPARPGVILSRAAAEMGGWQAGDEVALAPAEGENTNLLGEVETTSLPILAIVDLEPAQLALLAAALPPDVDRTRPVLIGLPWWTLAHLVGLDYEEALPNTYAIDLLNPSLNHTPTVQAIFRNQDSFSDRVAQTMVGVTGVMSAAAALMALVGGTGLLTIMSVNVFERQREIGLLRSVGATSFAILFQFLLEGLVLGCVAWAAGLPLSYLIAHYLVQNVPFGDLVIFHYAWFVPLLGLAGMTLVTTLATLYPSILASRQRVSDILRYK